MINPEEIKERIETAIAVKRSLLGQALTICHVAEAWRDALRAGNKVIFFGNGGSAADAQHLECELAGRFYLDRRPLPAVALTVNSSSLTAIGNDYGFEQVFARQLEGIAHPGDVAVGISTSGNSPNVVLALREGARAGPRHGRLHRARAADGCGSSATCGCRSIPRRRRGSRRDTSWPATSPARWWSGRCSESSLIVVGYDSQRPTGAGRSGRARTGSAESSGRGLGAQRNRFAVVEIDVRLGSRRDEGEGDRLAKPGVAPEQAQARPATQSDTRPGPSAGGTPRRR